MTDEIPRCVLVINIPLYQDLLALSTCHALAVCSQNIFSARTKWIFPHPARLAGRSNSLYSSPNSMNISQAGVKAARRFSIPPCLQFYHAMAGTLASRGPKRFAPLRENSTSDAPKLQGIVFDMDGTLWYVCLYY